ncbi:hypothetical protein [Labrys monachus]|uniref:Uncharacterized protein n=1 Tax=Labrys monachus TaxID=217067 RepID=A0ABU0FD30_9HYPH|nr:hypothetical protein [Labrys monachus]MDQ0392513.1 hypothetical protein [Labrys monachus]
MDIRYQWLKLTRNGNIRNYTVTRQFFNEDLSCDAALTATNFEGVRGGSFCTAGFVQCTSERGVEEFAGGLWDNPSGYDALNDYDTCFLQRDNVTTITMALTGNQGAMARFAFFIRSPTGSETKSARIWSDMAGPRQTVFAIDTATGEAVHIHETYGDKDFLARVSADDGLEKAALALAARGTKARLTAIKAAKTFRYDPLKHYRFDSARKSVVALPAGDPK